jgi:hypothetical protein
MLIVEFVNIIFWIRVNGEVKEFITHRGMKMSREVDCGNSCLLGLELELMRE